jgi:hypothetical protein
MKLGEIPEHVLEDVRKRGHSDGDIERMSAVDLFDEYCRWNGLIGFGDDLFETAVELYELEAECESANDE